ncbi:hypothetical protein A3765_28980 [Oleiphilus sp. HI0130]|uniref:hypothetical protein n=1 Tax=unclassified Oleiphilus TaxID=2631174 RepID=UPI0007C20974|nr:MULTISPECIES: hypothetical protein [unclassified Oleiphilus]KZY96100.1 hypothetical protein A3744_33670 [Oleiphilus sp. HI0073]KZZ40816.1 hypothetical protein A3758_08885 [Oleiphilus sp. HI0118]KZZ50763.1 hypothetical protein A3760_13635 [Oleiphilus sp. HI0122]KZZ72336.1 hypothetical protein A3765_28980 [Oleiphilus sp. HI0130]KZZ02386.1 hypothetical protein A3744_11110 [Oleiphilus sp. HI0073]
MSEYLIWIIVIALVYLDAMAIYYAHKSEMYEPIQLFFQALIVLCIPLVGALLILNFALSHIRSAPQYSGSSKSRSRVLELFFLTAIVASHSNSVGLSDDGAGSSHIDSGGFGGDGDG